MSDDKRMIFLDEDPDYRFHVHKESSEFSVRNLHDRTAALKNTNVDVLVICVNADRANFNSRVMESYLQRADAKTDQAPAFLKRMKLLEDQGIDSNEVLLSGARQNGYSPWLSIRMNDAHNNNDPDAAGHSEFWRTHPELWCESIEYPCDNTLDYSHECVRQRMLDFIAELLEKYDTDGLLLDWMRWPSYFPHNKGEERRGLLTDFMTQARRIVDDAQKRNGHKISLAARVPVEMHHALKFGLDAAEWGRRGLIDWLFLGNFFCALEVDVPVEEWRQAIGNENFPVAVTINVTFAAEPPSDELQRVTENDIRGTATSAWYHKADGVHPFNFMHCLDKDVPEELRQTVLFDICEPDKLKKMPRRHRINWSDSELWLSELDQMNRIPGFKEKWKAKCKAAGYAPAALPASLAVGESREWNICTAWKPVADKTNQLFIKTNDNALPEHLSIMLNGHNLEINERNDNYFIASVPTEYFVDGYTNVKICANSAAIEILQIYVDLNC